MLRTFVRLRETLTTHKDLAGKLAGLERKYDLIDQAGPFFGLPGAQVGVGMQVGTATLLETITRHRAARQQTGARRYAIVAADVRRPRGRKTR